LKYFKRIKKHCAFTLHRKLLNRFYWLSSLKNTELNRLFFPLQKAIDAYTLSNAIIISA